MPLTGPQGYTHTPGPWQAERTSFRDKHYAAIHGIAEKRTWGELATVAVRLSGEKRDSIEGLLNAQLIAAAPDLLAALKHCIEQLSAKRAPRRKNGKRKLDFDLELAIAEAGKAIFKAEGATNAG